jgi:polyhydroxybutyrate depolymerase
MKNNIHLSAVFISLFFISSGFGQWFDLNHDGVTRTYLMSYPNSLEDCPLIINMHGYTGNATQQQVYTQMDVYAHPQNIAVVYPQGMPNNQGITSWNVGTNWDGNSYDDVGFISAMIDDIASNFDIDLDRVYACGMSNGGYMAYELACELPDKITAFGSVTGNFMLNSNQDCDNGREIPIIHFHGTADGVVNYYPPSFDGSLTVGESIDYWSDFNNLTVDTMEALNDNVEIFTYESEVSSTQFVHFKVENGGHVWFGNNWGFHSSEELINFFLQYKLSDFYLEEIVNEYQSGWNLVGLPLEVEDSAYTVLFPEAIEGTFYSFDNGYNLATNFLHGEGYWLRFYNEGSTTFTGNPLNETTIGLDEGWNLISGISVPVNVSEIIDNDGIIMAGTIFGFSTSGYSNSDLIEPGKGYWVRTHSSGIITITSSIR